MRISNKILTAVAIVVGIGNAQEESLQRPATAPVVAALTSHGCFSSEGDLKDPVDQIPYFAHQPSSGFCHNDICKHLNATVSGMKGQKCLCGFAYPPKNTIVDDSKCDFKCPSYGSEACGGLGEPGYVSVFNTGIQVDVPYSNPSKDSKPTGSGSSDSADATESKDAKKGSTTSAGGIAAAVIGSIAGIGAIFGGVFFYMRRRRNQEIEDEHRRNAAVNGWVDRKPSSSGGLSVSDSRLDPVMAQRRLSDGSIADNQDYSRKILRVTNA